ncbi:ABC transporter ATP-binding protein [Pelolinea submarina]|uniref:ATP-binding cassette subfamily B protein n=1 Tax=Pelolinea submarina TaxID=913107 RepID=A0A347ZPT4_9CHLR|nr:ABC transporter ATP-binding protein [Pelolinea submarina]REG04670.1 ATP-binding cassette subfamily B protein [Pelolinea submarina]BBB47315.1 ABC type transport system ATP-binding protein and permease [Pelolinea submarina]
MLKKLSIYIKQYKKYILLVPVFVFLDVLCELSMPLLMARIVDQGIPAGDMAFIIKTGIFMVMLALGAIFFGVLNMKFSTTGAIGFAANLRSALFEKVQKFSFNNIDKFSTASLVTRLTNDVNNLQVTFIMGLRLLTRAPMMLVIAFFLAYRINARLSIVLAIAIPVLVIGVLSIISQAVKRFSIMQEKIDNINRVIQENLIGIRVVKSFVRADHENTKFRNANDDFTNSAIRAISLAILNMPVMMFVMNAATIAIIWMGGKMVSTGIMGTGELISFISYIFQILFSVMMISMMIIMSARAEASSKRIIEVLDTDIDIVDNPEFALSATLEGNNPALVPAAGEQDCPQVTAGKVEFKKVDFKYSLTGSGEDVLRDVSFVAEPGQIVGIVGGTASGKSTLVNLIPRLYDATAGAVLVDGVDVRDYRLPDLREKIGVVLQTNTLFSGTIRENIMWGNEQATEEEVVTACKDAQAHDFIMSFPNGYDTVMGQGGVNVSGGQKQRLCIARAILKNPKILILDDSTSAVDMATEARIREAFYHNLADTTIFIIAQRISSVQDADKIIVLEDGCISGIGTHAELLQNNEIYREINSSQQEGVLGQ